MLKKFVWKVDFKTENDIADAMKTVKALKGVLHAKFLDNKLTVRGDSDRKTIEKIIKIFGTPTFREETVEDDGIIKKKVMKLTFKTEDCKNNALTTVKELKGVIYAEFDERHNKLVRDLTVIGNPDYAEMKEILKIFTSAEEIPPKKPIQQKNQPNPKKG